MYTIDGSTYVILIVCTPMFAAYLLQYIICNGNHNTNFSRSTLLVKICFVYLSAMMIFRNKHSFALVFVLNSGYRNNK